MKKLTSLLIGLSIALFSFGQSPAINWFNNQSSGNSGINYVWTPIPSPPSFTSTATLTTACCAPTLEAGEISPAGRRQLYITGPTWNNTFIPNGLIGSSVSPFQYQSLDLNNRSLIGGSAIIAGQQVVTTLNNSTYQYNYSYDVTGYTDNTRAGISAFGLLSTAAGAVGLYQDHVVTNTSYAGWLLQSGNTSNTYSFTGSFLRIFGYPIEGEGLYLGSTVTPAGGSLFTDPTIVHDCLVYNKGRESYQFNGHNNVVAYKLTARLVGQAGISGQNNLWQFQNSHGTLDDSILDGAPVGMNIFSHGLIVTNTYFHWTGGSSSSGPVKSIFIGNLLSAYSSPVPPTNNPAGGSPGTITFINCYFDVDVASTEVAWVEDPNVTVEFQNCKFDPLFSTLYADHRGASNYSLVGTLTTNGNTVTSMPTPTYTNFDPAQPLTHGLCTTPTYYLLGMGYRNPR